MHAVVTTNSTAGLQLALAEPLSFGDRFGS